MNAWAPRLSRCRGPSRSASAGGLLDFSRHSARLRRLSAVKRGELALARMAVAPCSSCSISADSSVAVELTRIGTWVARRASSICGTLSPKPSASSIATSNRHRLMTLIAEAIVVTW